MPLPQALDPWGWALEHFDPPTGEQWRSAVERIVAAMYGLSDSVVEAVPALVDFYLPTAGRLEAKRLLTRIARKHVVDGDRIVWCAEVAGRINVNLRPSRDHVYWLMLTTQTCFVVPRRVGEPMAYSVQTVSWDDPCGFYGMTLKHGPLPAHDVSYVNGANPKAPSVSGSKATVSDAALEAFAALSVAQAAADPNLSSLVTLVKKASRKAAPSAQPAARLIRTARDAELVAAEGMRFWGYADARATPVGADEGIDVTAGTAVAQVKMEGVPTGRPVVQALLGAWVRKVHGADRAARRLSLEVAFGVKALLEQVVSRPEVPRTRSWLPPDGRGPGPQAVARAPRPLTPTWPCSLRKSWQAASSSHSFRAASWPRSRSCLAFCRMLICPNTGSTIALRRA